MISKAKVSLFDLDHTLIQANCSYHFGSYFYKRSGFSLLSMFYAVGCYVLHKTGALSLQGLHERLFRRLFKGSSAEPIKKMALQFVSESLSLLLYAPAFQRLKEAQQHGQRTIILSSSPDFLVERFAEALKVDAWAATPYRIDQHRFSAIGTVFDGEAKRDYVTRLLPTFEREAIAAYSDSHLDLPFLEAAGRAVAVNPDRCLLAICKRRGWEIMR